jgi:hypothetical protein
MAISGNRQYAVMKFTLAKLEQGGDWQFTAMDAYKPGQETDMDEAVAD